LQLQQTLQYTQLLCQCQVGLAQAAWQQGNMEAVRTHLQPALPVLTAGRLIGWDVAYTYWAAYQVLTAVKHPQAKDVLNQGASFISQQAATLADDPNVLHTFIHASVAHQALWQAGNEVALLG
jgi:hypothetical protein